MWEVAASDVSQYGETSKKEKQEEDYDCLGLCWKIRKKKAGGAKK